MPEAEAEGDLVVPGFTPGTGDLGVEATPVLSGRAEGYVDQMAR